MKTKIKVNTVTGICQIEGAKTEGSVKAIMVKTKPKLMDGMIIDIPIYSANGIRGLMRRISTSIFIYPLLKQGYKLSAEDFHAMNAGGGTNFQAQSLEVEEEIRALNPVVSLYGTSLAVEGKLIISDLEPEDPMIKIVENKGTGDVYAYSQILRKMIFINKDDIIQQTKFGKVISKEEAIKWIKKVQENREQREKERSLDTDKDKKTKKEEIQAILAKYFIIPGVTLKGYQGYKYPLTDIEKGLLIKTYIKLAEEYLGSSLNLAFGVCNWEIEIMNSGSKIVSEVNEDFLFDRKINAILSDEDKEYVKKFEEFLENITPKNVELKKILKPSSKTKSNTKTTNSKKQKNETNLNKEATSENKKVLPIEEIV